jgi:hypothetical protein
MAIIIITTISDAAAIKVYIVTGGRILRRWQQYQNLCNYDAIIIETIHGYH